MLYRIKQVLREVVPRKFVLLTHKIRAVLAVVVYGFPGRKIKAVAVAGTKGKTTTSHIIARILEEGGHKTAMLSTASFQIGGQKWLNDIKLTTTSPFYFQKFLKKAVEEKCDYIVVEISSHGLVQYRHWGVRYKTVVLTNMMSDHLDYHKTYDNYKNAHNALMTEDLESIVINYDDNNLRSFLDFNADKKYAFSLKGYKEIQEAVLVKAEDITLGRECSKFAILSENKRQEINLSLIGEFNIYNSLAAASAGLAERISMETIKKALESMKNIPGRLEKINEGQDFEVIIDYAHSPDSVRNVYELIKSYAKGKIIAVLGGTGDRDKTYRAKLGALADNYADIVIVTNEDPYSEDPEDIINQVVSGVKNKTLEKNLFRITDRKKAIEKAISLAETDDIVIITGKGSEQFIVYGDKKIPWDDRKVARQALRQERVVY